MTSEKEIEAILQALEAGDALTAHTLVTAALQDDADNAQLHYLRGKAYMKQSDWGNAMSSFLQAEQRDPDGPARQCRQMLTEIMDFYNKDMYNQ